MEDHLHHPPNNSNSSSSTPLPPPPPPPRRHHHHPTPHSSPPCGACKFLRRKCVEGCVFAPYFGTEQGAARFAAVHKVFGASNVTKLLLQMPVPRRHDAVLTVCYEAQARLSDPVYGCVSTILALQQQVASLQAELTILQSQLISSRLAVASALQVQQGSSSVSEYPTLLPQLITSTVLHPSYSTNSSTSNSMQVMNLTSCFHPSALDPSTGHAHHDQPISEGLELLHYPNSQDEDDQEAEGESRTSSAVFADTVFHTK